MRRIKKEELGALTSFMIEQFFEKEYMQTMMKGIETERAKQLSLDIYLHLFEYFFKYGDIFVLGDSFKAAIVGIDGKKRTLWTMLPFGLKTYKTCRKHLTKAEFKIYWKNSKILGEVSSLNWYNKHCKEKPYYGAFFAIDKNSRGAGICREMLEFWFDYVGAFKSSIAVETNSDDVVAIYEHFGFQLMETSVSKNEAIKEYRMLKTIQKDEADKPEENNHLESKIQRIDGRFIVREIADILGANKGLLFTIRKMLTSPGKTVRGYLSEERSRHVKPITFVIIASLIFTLVNHIIKSDVMHPLFHYHFGDESGTFLLLILDWLAKNVALSSIIFGIFLAFGVKLVFRKSEYNIFEIFVLLCFITGIQILLTTVATFTRFGIIENLAILYPFWAIAQFFDGKKVSSYLKALLSYILGAIPITGLLLLIYLIETKLFGGG